MNRVEISPRNIALFSAGAAGGAGLGFIVLLLLWLVIGGRSSSSAAGVAANQTDAAVAEESSTPEKSAGGNVSDRAAVKDSLSEVEEKLKRIALAFHNFHDTQRAFAYTRLRDLEVIEPNRRPRPTELSWRVHLLQYLEEVPLHSRFHLDEPWDSEHNIKLIEHMPSIYRLGKDKSTTTRFQVLTGPDMLFGQKKPARISDVRDGTRHTILLLVVGANKAVPWTKPDDAEIDPANPMAVLGNLSGRYIPCIGVDAKLLMLPKTIEPANFLALATPRGNEIIDGDTYRREYDENRWKGSGLLDRMLDR